MRAAWSIGVDIGATKTAIVVVDAAGDIVERCALPTACDKGGPDIFDRVARPLNDFLARYESINGIGIGLPGPVDSVRGIAINAVNLNWIKVSVRRELQRRLRRSLPIALDNDVNVGAIGEWTYGAAQGVDDFVYLAVGTGFGGAVISGGQLLRGVSDSEMELGHISLDPLHGRQCGCGLRGCLEMSISGKGLLAIVAEKIDAFPHSALASSARDTSAIIQHAEGGDDLAQQAIHEAATALGIACAWCLALFNPRRIVIGGGLAHAAWHLLEGRTRLTIKQRCLASNVAAADICLSRYSDAAKGAAALINHQQRKGATG